MQCVTSKKKIKALTTQYGLYSIFQSSDCDEIRTLLRPFLDCFPAPTEQFPIKTELSVEQVSAVTDVCAIRILNHSFHDNQFPVHIYIVVWCLFDFL
jgi:hypothetical protein